MILKRMHISNFRAIHNATIELNSHTAFLGANGTGKSTVLRAMERFYAKSSNVELDDFFGRQTGQPIEIALTFTEFSEDEMDTFGSRIHNGEMTVTRVFEANAGRNNGKYYGATLQYPGFSRIRSADGAREKRRLFAEFSDANDEFGFTPVTRVDDIEPQLAKWEGENADKCELSRDDGQFFGFTNVARGNLQRSTSFVFVPAVRDAAADAQDARGSVIAQLMELIVRSAIQQRDDVRQFRTRITDEYRELVDPERLPELNELSGSLSSTLQDYYRDTSVSLEWREPEEFSIPLPSTDVSLDEGGFSGPVHRKGHGLQRAFIVTLLQHLAHASAMTADQDEAQVDARGGEEDAVREAGEYVLPGLILAIEEPELYQHPTKQRHLQNVLTRLSNGTLPGVATRTQIMFATHSSLFVAVDRFDEIRLARRSVRADGEFPECSITFSTLQQVARRLERAHNLPEATFTADGLRARLHILGSEMAEGFFADLVLIVEGVSDKAALIAAARLAGFDLEANGVAVLQVDGKDNIDKPTAIFRELGIPVYVVWDCDTSAEDFQKNRMLQRLLDWPDEYDAETRVTETFATLNPKLEAVLREELTEAVYDRELQQTVDEFGLARRKDALKAPYAMSATLSRAEGSGHTSATLQAIITAVRQKCETS